MRRRQKNWLRRPRCRTLSPHPLTIEFHESCSSVLLTRMRRSSLIRAVSKVLLMVGGLWFLFGDHLLRAACNVNWAWAELLGIGGGVLVMAAGGLLQRAARDAKPNSADIA